MAVETGDADGLDESLQLEIELAEELHQPYPRWLTLVHESLRMFLRGRIDEADRLGAEAFQLGQDSVQPDAFAIYAGSLFSVWAAQGRAGELVAILEEACTSNPGIVGLRAALASAYCAANRPSEAQAILTDARQAGFSAINLDGVWLSTLVIFARVAAEVGDRDTAEELFDLLEPFGMQFASDGAHVQGSVAQALGRLAAVLHRDEEADRWFGAAEELEGRARAILMQAQTRQVWAEALVEREDATDRARARVLAEQARRVALEVGCAPVAERSARVLDAG
jgi:hypothetical protein